MKYLDGSEIVPLKERRVAALDLVLLEVPAGRFTMGSPLNEAEREDDETAHVVTISKAFWLGKTEVTQGQWQKVMGNNPSDFSGDPRRPVENVSWDEVALPHANTEISAPVFNRLHQLLMAVMVFIAFTSLLLT